MKFIDPVEGAFSLDVPRGWDNRGGTVRRNALQVFGYETTISPDGYTMVTVNDPSLLSYVIPTPLLAQAGFLEGSVYDGGGGTRYVVARYKSGQEFAASYGQQMLPHFCTDVRLARSAPRPDVGQQINGYYRPFGMAVEAGEAYFTCRKDTMLMESYIFVVTTSIRGQLGAIWYPIPLVGFLTPSHLSGVAAGLMSHMISSVHLNPQWIARQEGTAVAVSRIAAQTNAVISDSIMKTWENRVAVIDHVMDEGSRARLGIDFYANPATGQQYTVADTHNFYWSDARGYVVGTDTDTPPGPDYSRLQRVPAQ
jgi:hypothetical protein